MRISDWSSDVCSSDLIRAGRNLPDKEFRYLRTVIVTAAVYRGFDQELRLAADPINQPSGTGQASHPIRPLSCLQSAVFLLNSSTGPVPSAPPTSATHVAPRTAHPSPDVTVTSFPVPYTQ